MLDIIIYFLSFIVVIAILVTIHEYGHFWVARKVGIKVIRFSIGMGKPMYQWYGKDGVEYVIARWPIGGYVKMLGESSDETLSQEEKKQSFSHIALKKRFAVVLAGPMSNLVLAVLLFWVVLTLGIPGTKPIIGEVEKASIAAQLGIQSGEKIVSIDDQQTPTWGETILVLLGAVLADKTVTLKTIDQGANEKTYALDMRLASDSLNGKNPLTVLGIAQYTPDFEAIIAAVPEDGRAYQAGFLPGDKIIKADAKKITTWKQWFKYVRDRPEEKMTVQVLRQHSVVTISLTPKAIVGKEKTFGRAGVQLHIPEEIRNSLRSELKYSFFEALQYAFIRTVDISVLTLRMFGKMIIGEASLKNISGPLSIAEFAGKSAKIGLVPFLSFLAIISISLGVINLLPIPMLDGGHLVYFTLEAIKGSPISEKTLVIGQYIGISLLVMLMGLAFYHDIIRISAKFV